MPLRACYKLIMRCLSFVVLCLALVWTGPVQAQNSSTAPVQTNLPTPDSNKAAPAIAGQAAPVAPGYRVPVFNLPTNLTLCGERVPLDIPTIYESADREFQMAVYDPVQVIMWIKRAHRFFPWLDLKLKERGMPADLKYVAVAESALRIYAWSPAGAAGMWQFIKSTGRRYGLERSRRRDERLDHVMATEAALNYLQDLFNEFGSWTLAMAAYNCGEKRIRQEIAEQGQSSYFKLNLPRETERYIFRILSAKIILENPKRYGFRPDEVAKYKPLEFKTFRVHLKQPIHIRLVAKAARSYFKEMKELNPSWRGKILPAGDHKIRTPLAGSVGFEDRLETVIRQAGQQKAPADKPTALARKATDKVHQAIEVIKSKQRSRIYVVKSGDTLSAISKKVGVSIDHLRTSNKISGSKITVGQQLKY